MLVQPQHPAPGFRADAGQRLVGGDGFRAPPAEQGRAPGCCRVADDEGAAGPVQQRQHFADAAPFRPVHDHQVEHAGAGRQFVVLPHGDRPHRSGGLGPFRAVAAAGVAGPGVHGEVGGAGPAVGFEGRDQVRVQLVKSGGAAARVQSGTPLLFHAGDLADPGEHGRIGSGRHPPRRGPLPGAEREALGGLFRPAQPLAWTGGAEQGLGIPAGRDDLPARFCEES